MKCKCAVECCVTKHEALVTPFFMAFLEGNILGANQPLRANYENFNLDHQINIQGRWEGGFAKV